MYKLFSDPINSFVASSHGILKICGENVAIDVKSLYNGCLSPKVTKLKTKAVDACAEMLQGICENRANDSPPRGNFIAKIPNFYGFAGYNPEFLHR